MGVEIQGQTLSPPDTLALITTPTLAKTRRLSFGLLKRPDKLGIRHIARMNTHHQGPMLDALF